MIHRHPFTALALAILLTAGGIILASRLALAGGMPSDEGPEILIEKLGFDSGDSLDNDTITVIIKSQMPENLPDAYAAVVTVAETPQTAPPSAAELPPAHFSPDDYWWRRDHR